MTNYQLLNNVDHKDLKIDTTKSAKLGNDKTYSVIYPFEFKQVQVHYPIFFVQDDKSEFSAIALFGFAQDENLFLTSDHWEAGYIPLMVEREPFAIGYQTNENNESNPVIHIDTDSPRVNTEVGNDIFLPHGGNSEYINKVSSILKTIHDSQETTKHFMEAITTLGLLEPVNLDIELKNGSNNRLTGFHTINEEKVNALTGSDLERLNKAGFLTHIYMVIASHANIAALINKKNQIS